MIGYQRFLIGAFVLSAAALGAQTTPSPVCFTGNPPGSKCSGYILFEGSAARPMVSTKHAVSTHEVIIPNQTFRVEDLPEYVGGGIGYVKVVGPTHAVGAVAEWEYSNAAYGNGHRIALVYRDRRWFAPFVVDASAGPVAVQVPVLDAQGGCCSGRQLAYGGTAEVALTYRSWVGLTAGFDAVHGAGRTSTALKIGVRTGSWGSVTASIIAGIGSLILYEGLKGSD